MKMNNFFVKLLVSVLIILTLVNFISTTNISINYSFADTESEERVNEQTGGLFSNISNAIANFVKGFFVNIFRAIRSINYTLASAGGVVSSTSTGEISPFDIFFNRFTLLDANIFSTTNRDGIDLDQDSLVYKIRSNAAIWYYAIRTIAIAIIAIMLLWNLIRSISTNVSADQKAIAKNAITDWVLSFALVMFMHIIVIIVLNFNDVLLDGIQGFTPYANTADFFDALENTIFNPNWALSIAALVVYALLNWQTFKYILIYIQRLLTIVLLIMISPIVPITYSTNRMKGGNGATLNGWLKELLFNVFIQVLHAAVYAALVGVAMSALTTQTAVTGMNDIGPAIIAITAMLFIKYAERLVKSIFGFDSSQVLNNNVISEAVTNIGNVASTAVGIGGRAATRVATGGPLISFGKNVDGSHIGIGQVAGGLANSASRTFNSAKTGFGNVKTGISNIPGNFEKAVNSAGAGLRELKDDVTEGVKNTPSNLKNAARRTKNAFVSGFTGVDWNDEEDTASEAKNNETENAQSGDVIVVDAVAGNPDQQDVDKEQNRRNRNVQENVDDIAEGMSERDEHTHALEAAIAQTQESIENDEKHEETHEIHEETHEVVENNKEEIVQNEISEEIVEQGEPILVEVGGGMSPEVVDDFKKAIKAIDNDDKKTLEDIAGKLDVQLSDIGKKLSQKTINTLEKDVKSKLNNPQELSKYLKGIKNEDERKYAETFARFSAFIGPGNDNTMSSDQKIDMIKGVYEAQDISIPKDITKEAIDKLEGVVAKTTTEKSSSSDVNATSEGKTGNIINIADKIKAKADLQENGLDKKVDKALEEVSEETVNKALEEALKAWKSAGVELKDETELKEFYNVVASKKEEKFMQAMSKSDTPVGVAMNKTDEAVKLIQRAQKEGYDVFEANYEGKKVRGNVDTIINDMKSTKHKTINLAEERAKRNSAEQAAKKKGIA